MKTRVIFILLIFSLVQAACTAMSGPGPLFAEQGTAAVKSLDVWRINAIWKG